MEVYTVEELDKIDEWIENIVGSNKKMETLCEEMHQLKDQAQVKILEAEKHYSDACLDIFDDDALEKLVPVVVVAEKFHKTFEEYSNDDDIK